MAEITDWTSESMQDSIVFPTVQGVAVYLNEVGDVVLRQQGIDGHDDSFVVVPRHHASEVQQAIAHLIAASE